MTQGPLNITGLVPVSKQWESESFTDDVLRVAYRIVSSLCEYDSVRAIPSATVPGVFSLLLYWTQGICDVMLSSLQRNVLLSLIVDCTSICVTC